MDKELIRQLLPNHPRPGLLNWTQSNCNDELGKQYLVWRPERTPVYGMAELMTDNDWKPVRYERTARCTCLRCGYDFVTELNGHTLTFWVDECGEWWSLDPNGGQPFDDEETAESGYMVEIYGDGENLPCPMCYETLFTIPANKLRGGRQKQILVASIEVVGKYAAVVYWLVRRWIMEYRSYYEVLPRDAYVLDERGTLHRYTHTQGGGFTTESQISFWKLCTSKKDSLDSVYHDWGSISNKKKGGLFYENVPDLTGTTAEKTGLQAFAKLDGLYSVEYLKLWKKYRNLENLVNTGWTRLVHKIVSNSFHGYDAKAEMDKAIDISKAKPHEMLGMSRSDFRIIRQNDWQWDFEAQLLYRHCRESGLDSALRFHEYRSSFTAAGIRAVAHLQQQYGDGDFEKLERYLRKQGMRPSEVGILLDTRNAARALAGNRPLTDEELWPRNLQAAHDRLTRARIVKIDPVTAQSYQKGFDAALDKFGQLQWTDGELCIVMPKSYADLVQEGNVLRHCVGGYSEDHISGSHMIFFVRKYRRPERSYYTLDINMLGRPYRQQLHGYGNERHGIHKQYTHTIPQKVLEFCTRWEREILMPWYRDQTKKAKREGGSA